MQKFLFQEGLDKDTDVRLLPPTRYRDALNIRIRSMDGKNFIVTKLKGNTKKDNDLLDNIYNVIGSYDDKVGKRVFYFVTARVRTFVTTQDAVLEYNYDTDTTTTLIRGDLNLNKDFKITGVTLVDNKHLIWTDNRNEPRILDLSQLERIPNGLISSETDKRLIELAKAPLLTSINAQYSTDPTKDTNNLRGMAWQFAVIFTYKDGCRSIMSSYSNVPLPSDVTSSYFGASSPDYIDNQINITFNRPSSDISKIELCVRSKIADESPTEWWVTKSWSGEEAAELPTTVTHAFFNEGFEKFVDNNEVIQLGSAVPKLAKTLDLGYGNRVFMANIVEGFNLPTPNASLAWRYNTRPNFTNTSTLSASTSVITTDLPESQINVDPSTFPATPPDFEIQATVEESSGPPRSSRYYMSKDSNINGTRIVTTRFLPTLPTTPNQEFAIGEFTNTSVLTVKPQRRQITLSGTPTIGDKITVNIGLRYNGYFNDGTLIGNRTRTVSFSFYIITNDLTDLKEYLATYINNLDTSNPQSSPSLKNLGGIAASVDYNGEVTLLSGIESTNNATGEFSNTEITSLTATIDSGAAIGQVPPVYTYKRNRRHEFCINYYDKKGRKFAALTSQELRGTPLSWKDEVSRGSVNVDINIGHAPPEGAAAYSIGHRSQNYAFVEVIAQVTDVGSTATYGTNTYTATLVGLSDYRRKLSNTVIDYTWERGDLVEIYKTASGTDIFDSEKVIIQDYDTATDTLTFSQNTPNIATGTYLIALSKAPSGELNQPFNETGRLYAVEGGVHTGNVQTQTSSQPAIVRIDYHGDCFYRTRLFNDIVVQTDPEIKTTSKFYVEDESVSDFYRNSSTSAGKPNVSDPNFEEARKETAMVFTEPYVVEGFINGLGTVYDSSIEVYGNQHGSIQHIYSRGRVIDVYMQRRVGAVGIQQENALQTGGGVVYDTSTVLNTMEYYSGEYGIGNFPESFNVYGNSQYFVDDLRGVVCRKAENGIIPISEYKMISEFNSLLRRPSLPIQTIRTTFDRNNYELITTIGSEVYFTSFISTSANTTGETEIQLSGDLSNINVGDKVDLLFNVLGSAIYVEATVEGKIGNLSGNFTLTLSHEDKFISNWQLRQASALRRQINTTYSFYEIENFWQSRLSYQPEWLEELNTGLCSFKNGVLYTHETNVNKNEFYGVEYPSTLDIIFNENPSYPKRLKSIQEEGNYRWTVPSVTTNTLSGANRTKFQESNLTASNLKHVSNMFVSGFWKDINTVNVTNPRYEGNDLRGQYATIRLQNEDNEDVELFSVGINYIVTDTSNSE